MQSCVVSTNRHPGYGSGEELANTKLTSKEYHTVGEEEEDFRDLKFQVSDVLFFHRCGGMCADSNNNRGEIPWLCSIYYGKNNLNSKNTLIVVIIIIMLNTESCSSECSRPHPCYTGRHLGTGSVPTYDSTACNQRLTNPGFHLTWLTKWLNYRRSDLTENISYAQ